MIYLISYYLIGLLLTLFIIDSFDRKMMGIPGYLVFPLIMPFLSIIILFITIVDSIINLFKNG